MLRIGIRSLSPKRTVRPEGISPPKKDLISIGMVIQNLERVTHKEEGKGKRDFGFSSPSIKRKKPEILIKSNPQIFTDISNAEPQNFKFFKVIQKRKGNNTDKKKQDLDPPKVTKKSMMF